ncbi:hypothetical protein ACLKA6_010115 [Drosophila palustris]
MIRDTKLRYSSSVQISYVNAAASCRGWDATQMPSSDVARLRLLLPLAASAMEMAKAGKLPKLLWKCSHWAQGSLWPTAAVFQVRPYEPGAASLASEMTSVLAIEDDVAAGSDAARPAECCVDGSVLPRRDKQGR